MVDDLKKIGNPDRDKINMKEPWEVIGWTKKYNISKKTLQDAVDAVGVIVKDVENWLIKYNYWSPK